VGLPVVAEKQSVGQFLDRWLDQVAKPNTRPKTFELYEYAVRRDVAPILGKMPLTKLATQDVQGFLKSKSDAGLSPKTVKHLRDVLRNALNVAVEWDMILRNPAAKAKPPRSVRKEVTVFNPEQARCFLQAASGHRLGALFSTPLAAGLRRGEALGLHRNDVWLEAGTLRCAIRFNGPLANSCLAKPKLQRARQRSGSRKS
jgi:integrase